MSLNSILVKKSHSVFELFFAMSLKLWGLGLKFSCSQNFGQISWLKECRCLMVHFWSTIPNWLRTVKRNRCLSRVVVQLFCDWCEHCVSYWIKFLHVFVNVSTVLSLWYFYIVTNLALAPALVGFTITEPAKSIFGCICRKQIQYSAGLIPCKFSSWQVSA